MTAAAASLVQGLPPDLLDAAFPFHVVLDHELRILQTGGSLRRICPQFAVGAELDALASVVIPRDATSFASLKAMHDSMFLVELLGSDLKLRGQILHDRTADRLLLLGSPWISKLPDMVAMGLDLGDFSVSDNIVDYLLLLQTQGHALEQARDMAERLRQRTVQLSHQAAHDSLTGLPNRRLLLERIDATLHAGELMRTRTGLLLIDLDRFKEINDTFGHYYGDQLLVQVGGRLKSALRTVDTVARLGGDEFAVVLPDVKSEQVAIEFAAKLRAALDAPFLIEGVYLEVEGSVGVVVSGEHGSDGSTLLQRADVAMYVAKSRAIGIFAYDAGDDHHSAAGLALLGDLRRAIDHDELVLYYQPKVSLSSGEVVGAEALVRWQHPERGFVLPDAFIPLAERTGLIGPLSRYVLEVAITQARTWADANRRLIVSVNLSARNLLDEQFPDVVVQLLIAHGVAPDLLLLEVTETAIMTEPLKAQLVLERLSEIGVRISIDDFGAGYTSLGHLKTLPIDELKIDQSFVTEMTRDHSNAMIVRSVIDLGHDLGMTLVAEGIQDEATKTALAALGCDTAQGYHLGRPMPASVFDTWCDHRWRALQSLAVPPRRG